MTHILDEAAALFDNGNYSGQTVKKMLRELKEKKPYQQSADDVLDDLRGLCYELEPSPLLDSDTDRAERRTLTKITERIRELRKGGRE